MVFNIALKMFLVKLKLNILENLETVYCSYKEMKFL